MSHPILVTGAAGGPQGSTGRVIAVLLLQQGISVRAFVHKLDARSEELRQQGAEIFEGDLLNPASVQQAMENVERAYFTYPVADGLLEAATIFAATARDAGLGMVVNNSQFQGTPRRHAVYFCSGAYTVPGLNLDLVFDISMYTCASNADALSNIVISFKGVEQLGSAFPELIDALRKQITDQTISLPMQEIAKVLRPVDVINAHLSLGHDSAYIGIRIELWDPQWAASSGDTPRTVGYWLTFLPGRLPAAPFRWQRRTRLERVHRSGSDRPVRA